MSTFHNVNIRTALLSYNGLLTPYLYNMFFNPNLCHVCKLANNGRLLLCNKCGMISYCCIQHKIMHQDEHRAICKVTRKLLKANLLHMGRLTLTECYQLKEKLYRLVRERIHRSLQEYEIEMFFLAKTCYICHRWFRLRTCQSCFSANFCSNHIEEFYKYHDASKCRELLVHINFKITCLNINSLRSELLDRLFFYMLSGDTKCSTNIIDFMGVHIHSKNPNWIAKPWTTDLFSFRDYVYTDCLSHPLTLYYAMRDANLLHLLSRPVCVIHIIFSEYNCLLQSSFWEILFHLLGHEVRKIIIIYVSQYFVEPLDQYVQTPICDTCASHQKILFVQTWNLCYENYVFNTEYMRPNIIISFNAEENKWTKECVTTLRDQDCPLLLTFMSLHQTRNVIDNIDSILGVPRPHVKQNGFSSLVPLFNFTYYDLCYRNRYLAIYKKLKNSNEPGPSTSYT